MIRDPCSCLLAKGEATQQDYESATKDLVIRLQEGSACDSSRQTQDPDVEDMLPQLMRQNGLLTSVGMQCRTVALLLEREAHVSFDRRADESP